MATTRLQDSYDRSVHEPGVTALTRQEWADLDEDHPGTFILEERCPHTGELVMPADEYGSRVAAFEAAADRARLSPEAFEPAGLIRLMVVEVHRSSDGSYPVPMVRGARAW